MPELVINLLGSPQIQQADTSVGLSHTKAMALLAYLAVTQRPHSRDTLAGLFWPDDEQRKARAELRRMLWAINKGIGEGCLDSNRQTIGLVLNGEIFVDVNQFETLCTNWEAHSHANSEICQKCAADLAQAVALYQDHFMAGFFLPDSDNFERWQQEQTSEKRQLLEAALDKLMFWHMAHNDPMLVNWAEQRLKLAPEHEPTHRLLMLYYAKTQQITAALNQYQAYATAVEQELSLKPALDTNKLYEQIRDGKFAQDGWADAIVFPYKVVDEPQSARQSRSPSPLPISGTYSHNLPTSITPFIGRKAEIKQISSLLNDGAVRFISIVAPGGMGKTRLALEIGRQLLPAYRDGVFIVELAPLNDGTNIIPALADSVGYVFQQNGRTQKQQVLEYLEKKEILLLLDNFEHLLANASLVPELLRAAPQIKLLITSRLRLGQVGETFFPLSGMGLPDWQSTDSAFNYASIQLFKQTARRANPNFQLSVDNLPAVIRICQLVSGMPLGILLSASWISLLSPQEIVAEIENGLDILESDGGEVAARHRSLRIVFDSTWQMLDFGEQQAFIRMSHFRGGFSRDAAQQVAGANLRHLQALVNKSLIYPDIDSSRYQIHELVRQYGEERMASSGLNSEAAADHMRYFLNHLAEQTELLKQHLQSETLQRIETDFENIRKGWLKAITHRAFDLLDNSAEAMYLFCFLTSRLEDGKDLFDESRLRIVEATSHPAWYRFAIRFYSTERDVAELVSILGQAQSQAQQRNDQAEVAFCHFTLATIDHYVKQDPVEAIRQYEQAEKIYREQDEQYYLANTLSKLGEAYQMIGKTGRTLQYVNEAYLIQQAIGDQMGESETLRALSMTAFQQGEYKKAYDYLENAYDIQKGSNYLAGQAASLVFTGLMIFMDGNIKSGRLRMEAALKIALNIVDYSSQAWCYTLLATLEGVAGDLECASNYLNQALAIETDPFRQTGAGNPFLDLSIRFAQMILFAGQEDWDSLEKIIPNALEFACQTESRAYLTYFIPIVILIHAKNEQYASAAELLGLIFSQPSEATGWIRRWDLFAKLEEQLVGNLNGPTYQAALERGHGLDLLKAADVLLFDSSA